MKLPFLSFFTCVLYIFVLKIGINADYNLTYHKRVLLPIDMDISVEHTSLFRFERCGSYSSVNLVIISALPWAHFFNFEHGGSIFIHDIQNVQ